MRTSGTKPIYMAFFWPSHAFSYGRCGCVGCISQYCCYTHHEFLTLLLKALELFLSYWCYYLFYLILYLSINLWSWESDKVRGGRIKSCGIKRYVCIQDDLHARAHWLATRMIYQVKWASYNITVTAMHKEF